MANTRSRVKRNAKVLRKMFNRIDAVIKAIPKGTPNTGGCLTPEVNKLITKQHL